MTSDELCSALEARGFVREPPYSPWHRDRWWVWVVDDRWWLEERPKADDSVEYRGPLPASEAALNAILAAVGAEPAVPAPYHPKGDEG